MEMNACLSLLLYSYAYFFFAIPSESAEILYDDAKLLEIASKINYSRSNDVDMNPNIFQGDIYLTDEEKELIDLNITIYRNALNDPDKLWPGGKVYYSIVYDYQPDHKEKLNLAMNHIENQTCIQFVNADKEAPPHGHKIVINFVDDGCYSWIGFRRSTGPHQLVNLAPNCFDDVGVPEHELLHAIGLDHEQNRPDRDSYITIFRDNVEHSMMSNFDLNGDTTTFKLPYDYGSVMQYQNDAFSTRRGLATMVAKMNPKICLGNRHLATQCDLEKIRRLYKCKILNNCVPKIQLAVNNRCNLHA